jgi:hypothetical protein
MNYKRNQDIDISKNSKRVKLNPNELKRDGVNDAAYYSTDILVSYVYKWVKEYLALNGIDEKKPLFIAPHAGDGRMINKYINYKAYDKNPTGNVAKVIMCETKDLDLYKVSKGFDTIIIVDNPAFNNKINNNQYVEFFNHVAECDKVSIIMTVAPDRFRAHLCMRDLNSMFILDKYYPIINNSVMFMKASGLSPKIPTAFLIWKRSSTPRLVTKPRIVVEKYVDYRLYGKSPIFYIIRRPKVGNNPISQKSKKKGDSYPVYSSLSRKETKEIVENALKTIESETKCNLAFVDGNFQNAVNLVFPYN